jgi:hypothetical protein
MIFPNVDCYLAAREVENILLWLSELELHVVRRSYLSKDVSVIQNLLVQDVVILPRSLLPISSAPLTKF